MGSGLFSCVNTNLLIPRLACSMRWARSRDMGSGPISSLRFPLWGGALYTPLGGVYWRLWQQRCKQFSKAMPDHCRPQAPPRLMHESREGEQRRAMFRARFRGAGKSLAVPERLCLFGIFLCVAILTRFQALDRPHRVCANRNQSDMLCISICGS